MAVIGNETDVPKDLKGDDIFKDIVEMINAQTAEITKLETDKNARIKEINERLSQNIKKIEMLREV